MHDQSLRRHRVVRCLALLSVLSISFGTRPASGADWMRFRGPNGSGVSLDSDSLPTTWSPTENLQWKVELPGPGSSAPIVVGERVYVTCWSGYGTDRREPGDQKQLRRHLVCLDRNTGDIVWSKSIEPTLPEDEYGGMFAEHGYASHTPVSDGKRIYVYFGKTGALAFDLDGKQLWQTPSGTESDPRGWGSASSPILFENILIVTATAECEGLIGLDTETGKELWRKEASGLNATWGTPVLVPVNDQRTDLVIGVPNEIWGFNPKTGGFRWYCEAMQTDSFCSSVVANADSVIAIEGRGGGSIAVRAGGKGDVTESHVNWTGRQSNRVGTPIVYEGRIYFVSRGVINCVDAETGKKEFFKSRLEGGDSAGQGGGGPPNAESGSGRAGGSAPGGGGRGGGRRSGGRGGFGGDYASLVIGDGKLYFVTRTGNMFVLKAGESFEQLAVNRVTEESEDFSASPAISDGQLFIRSSRHLYCIAAAKETAAASPETE